ncbi:hypothetical protein C8J56DRAFT_1120796 [Mycena floridula]|nr:hypothetical protein C8J56DRAFT_1120796 [Mycena floridula]
MSKQIVLVTGGTGYVGSHVISQLLAQSRYTVRATARTEKASKIRAVFPDAGDNLQVVESNSSRPITPLLSVAPSFLKNETGQEILDGSYHGSIHLVKAAIAAGIKKIAVAGAFASLFDGESFFLEAVSRLKTLPSADFKAAFGSETLNENSWGSTTFESVNPETDAPAANPDVDVTVVITPAIFGPLVKGFPLSKNREDLGTIDFVYTLITALVESLDTPPLENGKDKRLIIMSKVFTWKELAQFLHQKRPELASRLPNEDVVLGPQTSAPLDIDLAKKVLGLSTHISWDETVLATIDEGLQWENLKL